jgi:putative flavoprotein involved in K+ transport
VTALPGLYFLGLPWLHTWGSGRFSGVTRDARYLAERIQGAIVAGAQERAPVAADAA